MGRHTCTQHTYEIMYALLSKGWDQMLYLKLREKNAIWLINALNEIILVNIL